MPGPPPLSALRFRGKEAVRFLRIELYGEIQPRSSFGEGLRRMQLIAAVPLINTGFQQATGVNEMNSYLSAPVLNRKFGGVALLWPPPYWV